MSKIITSPLQRWPGTVTIADPIDVLQAQAIEIGLELEPDPEEIAIARAALADAQKQYGNKDERTIRLLNELIEIGNKIRAWLSVEDKKHEPGIMACVEKWNLENFSLTTIGKLPASPRVDSHKLNKWLFDEIRKVYFGEVEVPKESAPVPISTPETAQDHQS